MPAATATDLIPEGGVILNVLHIIEYLDPEDDEIYHVDLSHDNAGDNLSIGKQLELTEWSRWFVVSPMIAEIVHDYVHEGDDEDDE